MSTDHRYHQRLALAFMLLAWAAILGTIVSGCDGNHIIGDPPTCAALVTDECVPEVIEEFCEEPPPICYTRDEAREHDRRLCLTCMNNVVCDDVDVVETDTDTCDLSVPVGHRPIECRGKGHSSLECDKNCGEYDPICIPCDLQVLAQHCETVCTPLPGGGVSCIQTCYDRTGRRV